MLITDGNPQITSEWMLYNGKIYDDDAIDMTPNVQNIVSVWGYRFIAISTKDAILYYKHSYDEDWNHMLAYYGKNDDFKNVEFSYYGTFKYNGKWYQMDSTILNGSFEPFIECYGELPDDERLICSTFVNDFACRIIGGNGKTRIKFSTYCGEKEYVINDYDDNPIIVERSLYDGSLVLSIGNEIYTVNPDATNPIERFVIMDDNGNLMEIGSKIVYLSIEEIYNVFNIITSDFTYYKLQFNKDEIVE